MRVLPLLMCLLSCSAVHSAPLLDGDCGDHRDAGVVPRILAQSVELYVHEYAGQLWLCATLAPGDLGTVDVQLVTPRYPRGINLHVSAQLGEWPLDRPDDAPTGANDARWWNHRGWSGSTLRFHGMEDVDGQRRPRLLPGRARELQIDVARFGAGTWNLLLRFQQLGGREELIYPDAGDEPLMIRIDDPVD
ncbi:MAG: hypothetical protein KDJ14_03365 [Xanthomonadales bacterium]|nr:hypothetical protein [Xanthomonadales bacterium]